jgi:hypothetical protein
LGQFEQDWLELGRGVACSLHYQHPRNLRLLHTAQADNTEESLAQGSRVAAVGPPSQACKQERNLDAAAAVGAE